MIPDRFTSDNVGFISNNDRQDIVKSIQDEYWPHIRAKGYYLVVKPYVRPEKNDGLMLTESMRYEDQHHSVAAQVIDIGPVAYSYGDTCGNVSWAQVGDWVFIPRVAGARVAIKKNGTDVMLRIVKEDDIIATIKDPSEWEIRITTTKF